MRAFNSDTLANESKRLRYREKYICESTNIRLGRVTMALDVYKRVLRNECDGNVRKLCRRYRITPAQHDIALMLAVGHAKRIKDSHVAYK